jgi:hypothetical protein
MTESERAFRFKETRTPSFYRGSYGMRCYFIRGRQVAGALPTGLSDQDAIARADKLFAKRKGPIDASRSGTVLVWS